jgi:hypothetical protein
VAAERAEHTPQPRRVRGEFAVATTGLHRVARGTQVGRGRLVVSGNRRDLRKVLFRIHPEFARPLVRSERDRPRFLDPVEHREQDRAQGEGRRTRFLGLCRVECLQRLVGRSRPEYQRNTESEQPVVRRAGARVRDRLLRSLCPILKAGAHVGDGPERAPRVDESLVVACGFQQRQGLAHESLGLVRRALRHVQTHLVE